MMKESAPALDETLLIGTAIGHVRLGETQLLAVPLRLPSYRALPLSCVESLKLSIDGREVPQSALRLRLNGSVYSIDELPDLHQVFWWILDPAHLLFPAAMLTGDKPSTVSVEMATVEPYLSAGRFSFFHRAARAMNLSSTEIYA